MCFLKDPCFGGVDFIEVFDFYRRHCPAEFPKGCFFLKPKSDWKNVCLYFLCFLNLWFFTGWRSHCWFLQIAGGRANVHGIHQTFLDCIWF